jgi:hypothetical protein
MVIGHHIRRFYDFMRERNSFHLSDLILGLGVSQEVFI